MAQKLRACDKHEVQQVCSEGKDGRHDQQDELYQVLDRWIKLDSPTQQKVLNLISRGSVRDEVHRLRAHINQLMETSRNRLIDDKEKGQ